MRKSNTLREPPWQAIEMAKDKLSRVACPSRRLGRALCPSDFAASVPANQGILHVSAAARTT